MKQIAIFFVCCLVAANVNSQDLTQVVKGKVMDRLTGAGLPGAGIKLSGPAGDFATAADDKGMFSVTAPVGRYRLTVTFTGYRTEHDEVLLIAAKESFVNVTLDKGETLLATVEVESASATDDIPGLQSLSIEKTLRMPANFFDPVRVVTSYPAVVAANDQSNAIIVRGNSPNSLAWRLNGLNIVNPNHLSNAGTLSDRPAANGGGVNIVSAQMLDRTDFYFGAMPANYGNALAGIVDMQFRDGNRSRYNFTGQASLIGLDFAAEGPLTGSGKSSFLANYRYSTVGLLSAAGVDFGDERIMFQDFSFHGSAEGKRGGRFSFFGLWGDSKNEFNAKPSDEWEEDKDRYDIDYVAQTFALGANYVMLMKNGKFFGGVAFSQSDQQRSAIAGPDVSLLERILVLDDFDGLTGILSTNARFELRAGSKSKVEFGIMADHLNNDVRLNRVRRCPGCGSDDTQTVVGNNRGLLLQPFASFSSSLTPSLNVSTGMRYAHYSYNSTGAFEPRVAVSVTPGSRSGLTLAYSLVSQLQLAQVYLAEGNSDLGLTRSHHVDLGYWQQLSASVKLKTGIFYQYLFDVPVQSDPTSAFSAINLIDEVPPSGLTNDGTGENYGIEAGLEKYFYGNSYMLAGASYYQSYFVAADLVERESRFNGRYTVNAVYGKEWTKPSRNRTIGLSTRVLYLGGMKESGVDVIASETEGETVYNSSEPYTERLKDYFRLDLRVSFRKNKPGYTRTFAIDIQNLSGQENEASHYYDHLQQRVVTRYQLGIIPVLVYRIDF